MQIFWSCLFLILFPFFVEKYPNLDNDIYYLISITLLGTLAFYIFLKRDYLLQYEAPVTRSVFAKHFTYLLLSGFTIMGFILRAWNLSYIQGTDTFNIMSALSLHETGTFSYPRNLHITYIGALIFNLFGQSMEAIRLPFVFLGTISIPLLYLLGKKINTQIGLISAFLLAISPVAIEESSFIREYAELFFWSLVTTNILLFLYLKNKWSLRNYIKYYGNWSLFLAGFIFAYSFIFQTATLKSILLIIGLLGISTNFFVIQRHVPKYVLKYAFYTILVSTILSFFIYIPLTLFSSHFEFVPYWAAMFFDPMVQTPMQWFSFSSLPSLFFFGFFCLPLIVKHSKKDIIYILYFVFFAIVLLFVFKYYNAMGYYHSRYLYFAYPFYIVGFACAIYYTFLVIRISLIRALLPIWIVFLILFIIILPNTKHAALHDLSIWGSTDYGRQPTSSGNRNFFRNVISFLDKLGVTSNDTIVIQGEGASYLAWFMHYPLTRRYTLPNGDTFEIGDKIFLADKNAGVFEMDEAVKRYNTGYLIWHSSLYSEKDFDEYGVHFVYKGTVEGYKIYRWEAAPSLTSFK
jgi:hypothetical protein